MHNMLFFSLLVMTATLLTESVITSTISQHQFQPIVLEIDSEYTFVYNIHDDLLQVLSIFVENCYQFREDRITRRNELYNNILVSVIVKSRERYPIPIKVWVVFDGYELALTREIGVTDNYYAIISQVQKEISEHLDFIELHKCMKYILENSWEVVNGAMRQAHRDLFISEAQAIVRNESIVFIYAIPPAVPTGMGNVLKGLISFMRVHRNTKIRNFYGYLMGNYSTILDSRHIHHEVDVDTVSTAEKVTTFRWLVLKEEEAEFDFTNSRLYDLGILSKENVKIGDNAKLLPLFSSTVSFDFLYNVTLLPTRIVKSILKVIRSIRFSDEVIDSVADASDSLAQPSLGVTVRSWTAPHEKNYSISLSQKYSSLSYQKRILEIISTHHVRSLMIAFDNQDLAAEYLPFLMSLPVHVDVHLFNHSANVDPLFKAAVEMLSLSETTYLLGDNSSSFVNLIYWFGKCRQRVYHP